MGNRAVITTEDKHLHLKDFHTCKLLSRQQIVNILSELLDNHDKIDLVNIMMAIHGYYDTINNCDASIKLSQGVSEDYDMGANLATKEKEVN